MTAGKRPSAEEIADLYERMQTDPIFAAVVIEIGSMFKPMPSMKCSLDEAETEIREMTDDIGKACLSGWCQYKSDASTAAEVAVGGCRPHEKKSF